MYVHVVKRQETIYGIGRSVGVGADEIARVNGLVSEKLVPGSSLLIPTQVPTTLRTYAVQEGDTLRKVASRFHVPEKIVRAANPSHVASEQLTAGDVLTLPVPLPEKRPIELNVRMEMQGESAERLTMEAAGGSFSSVSLANAWVERDGTITLTEGTERRLQDVQDRLAAKLLLLVTPVDDWAAERLLTHALTRRAFFTDLRMWVGPDAFFGVHVELTSLSPHLRVPFQNFVRELTARVHQLRGKVYLAVPPHVEDDPEHPRTGAYDALMLARYVDRIVWSAEEGYGRLDGPPTALAPLHLLRRSLQYALRAVPRHKLLLGLPLYGYDWPHPYDPEQLANLVIDGPSGESEDGSVAVEQVHWDDRAMTPMYTYRDEQTGERREVWYEDVRSVAAKLHLVQELGLAGVSCLIFGGAMPAQWELLADTFERSDLQEDV